ncbi:MAG: rhomboid family intramembrane serine protease [Firmicutes bacterium]|jgi:membrane associated rhomboid family serine protease|nr:rhomboid family intramembrane serine protease [Bacillota bacterium]
MKSEAIRNSPATFALLLVNVIVFAILTLSPDLAGVFLLDPSLVWEKPWTLVTVFFSHELPIHILLNMLLLVVFGTRLEKETHARVILGVYLLCGFIGSLSTVAYAAAIGYQGGLTAGASASAFGIAAAYAALKPDAVILKSKARNWVIALFVVNALLTVQNAQVSVGGAAHALGIIVGLAIGYAIRKRNSKTQATA